MSRENCRLVSLVTDPPHACGSSEGLSRSFLYWSELLNSFSGFFLFPPPVTQQLCHFEFYRIGKSSNCLSTTHFCRVVKILQPSCLSIVDSNDNTMQSFQKCIAPSLIQFKKMSKIFIISIFCHWFGSSVIFKILKINSEALTRYIEYYMEPTHPVDCSVKRVINGLKSQRTFSIIIKLISFWNQ